MASVNVDQVHLRNCMLFLFHQGKNATEATKTICSTYGDVLQVNKCQRWFRRFRSGNFSISDDKRSGRPSNLDNKVLKSLIESDPRLTIQELSEKLNVSWSTVQEHLKKIGKVNRRGIWFPHELSEKNKAQRRIICNSLLTRQLKEPFLERVVTGDEKWVLYVNTERKNQWLTPGQSPIPTSKTGLHPKKVLLCVWWDICGIIHFELMPQGRTITADIYCDQLDRLNEALKAKRPALMNRKGVILQQDNARPHSAQITQKKIRQLDWEVLPHPAYSPDVAPSDYHLFRSLEHKLRNKTFRNPDDVNSHLEGFFGSKDGNFYKEGIMKLQDRWKKVVESDGNYIID
jgi:histone-lysine N-methyltransferase SETMAR